MLIRFLLIALISFSSLVTANKSDLVITRQGEIFKDFTLGMYEDSSASLAFEEIKQLKEFIPQTNYISRGYSNSVFWIKFKIENATKSNVNYFIKFTNNAIHKFDCYIVSNNGETIKYQQGVGYFTPKTSNPLVSPEFQVYLNSGESKTVYFSLFSIYPNFTSLYIFDKKSLNNYVLKYDVLYSIYFGGVIALLLYNLFIYMFSREKSYLYYVLYVSFFLCWQLQTNVFFPFNTYSSTASYYTHGIFIPLFIASLLLFSRSILETKKRLPKMDRAMKTIAYLYLILAVSSLFYLHISFIIINGLATLIMPFILYVGFKSYFSGNKVALFFIVAQIVFLSTSTLFSLMTDGYLQYSLLTRHGIVVGSFIEIILFSLALAYRIRLLEHEKVTIIYQSNIELEDKVKERTKELEQSKNKLKELANRDPMTTLYNRRFLCEISPELISIAKREKSPLSIIVFDIDKFKSINDTYGHSAGDQVIKTVAKLLQKTRESDIAARVGGEEFVLLLPNTDKQGAYKIAKQIRKEVESLKLQVRSRYTINFTLSGGVCTLLSDEDTDIDQMLHRADKALYTAKETGRNKIVLSNLD
ncbi:MAG: diguanylate cyclase [Methyloprofundus sp.]|nr:diguanylate cyclase [Methyloprofundus sp.]